MLSEKEYAHKVLSGHVALINNCVSTYKLAGAEETLVMGRVLLNALAGMLNQFMAVEYLTDASRRELLSEIEPSNRVLFGTSGTAK